MQLRGTDKSVMRHSGTLAHISSSRERVAQLELSELHLVSTCTFNSLSLLYEACAGRTQHHHSPPPSIMDEPALFICDPQTHTMGSSLEQYLAQKIPPSIENPRVCRVIVADFYDEANTTWTTLDGPEALAPHHPTTTVLDSTSIRVNCFPSANYILHYASLVASYLWLRGRDPAIVQAVFPRPAQAAGIIAKSNLSSLGAAEVVILGDIHWLTDLCSGQWQGAGAHGRGLFRWKKWTSPRGRKVALVQCVERLWGQAGHHVLESLHRRNDAKCVIYVAKAGSLSPAYSPNKWIATGDRCLVEERTVKWENVLQDACGASAEVAHGDIVTVPTTMCETQEWLRQWSPRAVWVDCEVGYMASAAVECGLGFGFLDIVSDNLHENDGENLSNEESAVVFMKRKILYTKIVSILEKFISEWDGDCRRNRSNKNPLQPYNNS
jgi:hypothetical protein